MSASAPLPPLPVRVSRRKEAPQSVHLLDLDARGSRGRYLIEERRPDAATPARITLYLTPNNDRIPDPRFRRMLPVGALLAQINASIPPVVTLLAWRGIDAEAEPVNVEDQLVATARNLILQAVVLLSNMQGSYSPWRPLGQWIQQNDTVFLAGSSTNIPTASVEDR